MISLILHTSLIWLLTMLGNTTSTTTSPAMSRPAPTRKIIAADTRHIQTRLAILPEDSEKKDSAREFQVIKLTIK